MTNTFSKIATPLPTQTISEIRKGKWEEVYAVYDAANVTALVEFQTDTTYYQTFGGGGEGGYFVKLSPDDEDDLNKSPSVVGIWAVERNWGTPWTIKLLTTPHKKIRLQYQPADEMKGRTARIRSLRYIQRLNFKAHLIE